MKAVVFRGIGDIRLEDVKDPTLQSPTDAIVRITASAICGTDLHLVRGTLPGMAPGTILGHEGIGIVEEVGADVRNLRKGDRVVIACTIACGTCVYCRAGYHSQCNDANPNGPDAGTAFFGGTEDSGPFHGLQAEAVRVPYAHVGLVKLPDEVSDDDAILLSDIYPTAHYATRLAEVTAGDVVAVFGCGPVGQLAIASALMAGAGRVFAVDRAADRLEQAAQQGAEVINFENEDPVEVIKRLTSGIGADRAIDAVGVDAEPSHRGQPPDAPADHGQWVPGQAPAQALDWAVDALAKAGTLGVVGVYPDSASRFAIGKAMNKNLSINLGNCPHRALIPELIGLIRSNGFHPSKILTNRLSFDSAIDAYEAFNRRAPGWTKVELRPAA